MRRSKWPLRRIQQVLILFRNGLHLALRSRFGRLWMRIGHAAKGALYGLIGLLTLRSLGNAAREIGGSKAVMDILDDRFAGSFILTFLAFGLLGYVLWRIVQAVLDPSHDDSLSLHSLVQRLGYLCSGLTYLGVAYTAGQVAIGLAIDFDDTVEDATAVLFDWPIGPWVVLIAGLFVIGIGCAYIYGAFSGSFISRFQTEFHRTVKQWTVLLGKIGFTARGVGFILVGSYLVLAAFHIENNLAGGLGETLAQLGEQRFGALWLSAIALGFIAYATYMVISAFYRKFPQHHSKNTKKAAKIRLSDR
ncbi:DUF1206 domain-containing protein [Oscillatoria sp. CS-180]|uniref:DUF1206 domain-containing protein n=1 Tax=Oscillatoria sp. CS-180 TaxID=3021720 RepID=UPI0023313841|nr:DUF1206 domain-containing protein [Oscillatoria sp. CS-180]MDB9528450.1 DUF1206 domain-containing protein [Oscillatoria sp. CS-180]